MFNCQSNGITPFKERNATLETKFRANGAAIDDALGAIANEAVALENEDTSSRTRIAKRNKWVELEHKRILIVEDEPMQALHIAMMVKELGAEVAGIATSVQAALAEISVTPFDCATLDLNLQGFFSLGMVKGLRDMKIPFVICTAYGEIASSLPEVPVVEKPVTIEALADALHEAMKGR